ncbi:pPR-type GPCR protein [Rhizoclosmatium globosum]|uniref:PPR-type GPCR protein n=1 Tax=Rhizoclosmatium globosum TaxID=329046 RepID=A0A1Y2BZW6_9FUNG|nr:pPR-type GPCR protein [Rhizoclosmatium globosum]|eukprot:ORY39605.1 pPR-type GPCR protein [Rhizoclosmatium globosum]
MAPRTRAMRRQQINGDESESDIPLQGSQTSLTRSQKQNVHETISIKQIPAWMFDNAYILSGYRQEMGNYRDCFYSLLYVHNETGNIFSHLIGSLLHLGWLIYMLTSSANLVKSTVFITGDVVSGDAELISTITWKDFAVVSAFMVSAIACMGLSAAFHTFHCHSFKVSKAWNKLDFAGIAGLIAGSNIPFIYYGFYCEIKFQTLYIALMTTFGIVTTLITFVCWNGVSSVVPIIHLLIEHGYDYVNMAMGLNHGIFGGACYLIGAFLYASRFPERLFPGKCDHWFQSHQIFHMLVLTATIAHFRGICLSVMHRHVDNLAACPT